MKHLTLLLVAIFGVACASESNKKDSITTNSVDHRAADHKPAPTANSSGLKPTAAPVVNAPAVKPSDAPAARPTDVTAAQGVDPVAAKAKQLKLRDTPTTLHNGMSMIERIHAEEKLEAWAKGGNIDPPLVLEFTARLSNVLSRIDWKDSKKRERNPADYDRLVSESITGTKALYGHANSPAEFKKTADALLQSCVDCHTLYR